jgi:hypothetical protein
VTRIEQAAVPGSDHVNRIWQTMQVARDLQLVRGHCRSNAGGLLENSGRFTSALQRSDFGVAQKLQDRAA